MPINDVDNYFFYIILWIKNHMGALCWDTLNGYIETIDCP